MDQARLIQGEVIEPQQVVRDRRLPNIPRLSGSGLPFTLCFLHGWEFIEPEPKGIGKHVHEDGEWVPEYREIRHNPGANGVTVRGRGPTATINPTAALIGMRQKGAEIIRPGDRRMGRFANYLTRHKMYGKYPFFYCFSCVRMVMLNNDTEAEPVIDYRWLLGLRRQLVAGGIAEPMSPQMLDTKLREIRNKVVKWREMVERGQLGAQAYTDRAEASEFLMGAMTEAWERQYAASYQDLLESMDALPGEDYTPDYEEDLPPAPLASTIQPKAPTPVKEEPAAEIDPEPDPPKKAKK